MNFGKKILLIGIALLIFLSVLSSIRTSEYVLESKLKKQSLTSQDTDLSIPIDTAFKDFALNDSTFVRKDKKTKIEIKDEVFSISSGDVFFTGTVQSRKKIQLNNNSQIHLKDFSVLVSKKENTILIMAFEKPVPVFINNFAFLIPSKSVITIPSSSTTPIKEFSHQDIAKLFFLTHVKELSSTEEGALKAYKEWQKSFRSIVLDTPKVWKKHTISGFGAMFRKWQSSAALFIPQEKRAAWFFSEKMNLLYYGINFLENRQNEEAEKTFEFLKKQLKANESLFFFQSYPEFKLKWDNYQNAIAIFSNLKGDRESVSLQSLLDNEAIEFSLLENALVQKNGVQAKKIIQNMGIFGSNRAQRIRLFWNIYQNELIQTAEAVKLFSTFDVNNISNAETREVKDEILLLLKQKNDAYQEESLIIETLSKMLEDLNFEKFGTEEEKEFLYFTKKIKTMGLTKEEIERTKQEEAIQKELENSFEIEEEEEEESEIEKVDAVKNTKMLISFLEDKGINVIRNTIKSNREDNTTTFAGVLGEQKIVGKFHYNSQYFEEITINNDEAYQNVFRNEIGRIIETLKTIDKENTQTEKINLYKKNLETSSISQQTKNAILAKNLIAKELQQFGFKKISTEKMTIINQKYSRAQISGLEIGLAQNVQIIFDSSSKKFENFVGKIRRDVVENTGEFSFEALEIFINEYYEAAQ